MNHVIHIAAIRQIRLDTDGRAYCRRAPKLPCPLAGRMPSTPRAHVVTPQLQRGLDQFLEKCEAEWSPYPRHF